MDFKDIWNFIVNKHESDKNKDERVVQESWETYFSEFFGYKKLFGEIDAQRRVHIGSREREIPDIILRSDNLDLCDIELKRYCSDFKMDMEEQLMSYLNQLHLSVGVLVCKCLYIYCYNYVEKKIKKVEIQFTKDNLDGIEFVELFQKENFDKEKIETFINNKLSFGENIKKIKNEITLNIKSILKEYFSHSHLYTENEINDALKDVEIKTEGNIISLLLNKNVKTCSLGNIEKIKDKITLENVSFLLKTYFSGVFTEDETNKALKDIRVDIVQANQHESKEIKLPQNPHMLKVGDCIEARTHYEFLNKVFGKNYKLWGSCVWKFDSDTIVWMVRFNKVCDGWRNTFLTKDCIMEENLEAKPDWKGTKVENEPTLRMRRVVIEIDGKSYNRRYIFKGVFKYDQERSDPYSIRYHNKIADDFYF